MVTDDDDLIDFVTQSFPDHMHLKLGTWKQFAELAPNQSDTVFYVYTDQIPPEDTFKVTAFFRGANNYLVQICPSEQGRIKRAIYVDRVTQFWRVWIYHCTLSLSSNIDPMQEFIFALVR